MEDKITKRQELAEEYEAYQSTKWEFWYIEKQAPSFHADHYELFIDDDSWIFARRIRLFFLAIWKNIISDIKLNEAFIHDQFLKYFPLKAGYWEKKGKQFEECVTMFSEDCQTLIKLQQLLISQNQLETKLVNYLTRTTRVKNDFNWKIKSYFPSFSMGDCGCDCPLGSIEK